MKKNLFEMTDPGIEVQAGIFPVIAFDGAQADNSLWLPG